MTALLASPGNSVAELYPTAMLDEPAPLPPADRSEVIDQAYSEYRNLCRAGVQVDPDAFWRGSQLTKRRCGRSWKSSAS